MSENTLSYIINGQELVFEKNYYDYICKKGNLKIQLQQNGHNFVCDLMFDNKVDTEIHTRVTSTISHLDNLSKLCDNIKKLSIEAIPQIEKGLNIKWF